MKTIKLTDTNYEILFVLSTKTKRSDQIILGESILVEIHKEIFLKIPFGYVTDFHSVPPLLWSIWPPFSTKTNLAAMVHDYLYERGADDANRKTVDEIFLLLMNQFAPDQKRRNRLYYLAVRWFGGNNWRRFREKNNF